MFMKRYEIAINGGTVFDGTLGPRQSASVGISNGRVTCLRREPFGPHEADVRVDATGQWVTPGFLDVHTHYDAEVEAAPALAESLVHGVTTVMMGSCSLGAVLSEPLD